MKFKPTTVALVAIALLLGGVVYLTEQRRASNPEATEATGGSIFEFEESQVQSFTVEMSAQTLSFERDDSGQWQMQEPQPGLASDASVAYLLNLLATEESDRTLTVDAASAAEFGLDEPSATITVTLDNQETHQLILGSTNFDNSAIYAQADPDAKAATSEANAEQANAEQTAGEAAEITVLLVSSNFENAVNRPLEEWRSQATDETNMPSSPPVSEPEVSPGASESEASESEASPPSDGSAESPAAEN
jgi:hypothetical protein